MRHLLYMTFVNLQDSRSIGVVKKIRAQVKVFANAGFRVTLLAEDGNGICIQRTDNDTELVHNSSLPSLRLKLCNAVKDFIIKEHVDCCYLRSQFFSPDVLSVLNAMKKRNIKVLVEIPTYPYDKELIAQGAKGLLKLACDSFFKNFIHRFVDRIVTFSDDKLIFRVPTICMVNGININETKTRTPLPLNNCIHIITVSSMMKWHGYDRFIIGLGEYYKNGGNRAIFLHIVGNGEEINLYKKLVDEYSLHSRIAFYGSCEEEKLSTIYDECSIGLSVLAMHRKSMNYASSLKAIEYGLKGLPFITACKENNFYSDVDFILKVPDSEESIDIDRVIDFYDYIYRADRSVVEVAEEISNYAKKTCDINITMKAVTEYLLQ